jgi:general secretion pathway protein M
VQSARSQVHDRQTKKAAITLRYQKRAPALAGMIEQLATAQKLEVVDSADRPDQPHGKKFTERATTVHLKKAGMLAIAKFLESVEQSGYPVIVSQIDLRKRAGEPDSYDVEVTISAYDRVEATAPTPAASSSASGGGNSP